MRWIFSCLILLLGLSSLQPALAASDIPEGYQLRMDFLEERLENNRSRALYWQYGWTGFYAATTVLQTALWADADDSDEEIYYSVGALKSLGGFANMLLRPHPGRHGATPVQEMPRETDLQRNQRLERGELLLRASARRSEVRRTWKPHTMVIGLNLVAGTIIAVAGDEGDALASTAIGIAIGEANIWTQPSGPEEDWREYQQKFTKQSGLQWQVVPFGTGLAITGRF